VVATNGPASSDLIESKHGCHHRSARPTSMLGPHSGSAALPSPDDCATLGPSSEGTVTERGRELIDDDALDRLEREFIARVRGRVLEVGAGDGENFGAFHSEVQWIGLEPDQSRRTELATRAREWKHPAAPLDARAEAIPLPDHSVDAVVATYVMCSVTDLDRVIAEFRRVLVPGGRIVLVDHVIAPPGTAKRVMQRLGTPFSKRFCHGCHWDRDPEPALDAAGFIGTDVRRLGVRPAPFGPTPVLLFDGRSPAAS
jgi:SAM-dependent methyltransferase